MCGGTTTTYMYQGIISWMAFSRQEEQEMLKGWLMDGGRVFLTSRDSEEDVCYV